MGYEKVSFNGRIVPLDRDTNQIDQTLFDMLPEHLRPNSSDDVGVILSLSCEKEVVGRYVGKSGRESGLAYRQSCYVRFHYRKSTKPLYGQSHLGPDPPDRPVGGGERVGERPYAAIVASLPNR